MNQIGVASNSISTFGSADENAVVVVSASDFYELLARVQGLEKRVESLQIENELLRAEVEELNQRVDHVHEDTLIEIAADRRRITAIEQRRHSVDLDIVQGYAERLTEEMVRHGLRQVSITMAAKLLGLSRSRMHEIKVAMVECGMFLLVRDPRHKQRELLRLSAEVKPSGRTVDSLR